MKRIEIAHLVQKTSSFSPRKTTLVDFKQFGLHFVDKKRVQDWYKLSVLGAFISDLALPTVPQSQ